MKTREQRKQETKPKHSSNDEDCQIQGYYDESWFPCKIIRAKEELPKKHRNLWKQKETKCQQFGKDSHEVVYWFEDDPPAYSVLASNYMKGLDSANMKDGEAELQETKRQVTKLLKEKNKLEADLGEVMESLEETHQSLKETKRRHDATNKRLATLEAKCEMDAKTLQKTRAKLEEHEAKQLKDAEERGALKEEIKRLRATNKDTATELHQAKNRGIQGDASLPQIEHLQDKIEDLKEQLRNKEKDIVELRKDKEDMRSVNDFLLPQLKSLQREKEKDMAELEKKDDIIESLLAGQCDGRFQVSNSNALDTALGTPATPKRSHGELLGAPNDESTVEKARKRKRMNEVEVKARMEGIMDGVQF